MSPSDVRSVAVGFAFGAVTTPIVPAPVAGRPGGRGALRVPVSPSRVNRGNQAVDMLVGPTEVDLRRAPQWR